MMKERNMVKFSKEVKKVFEMLKRKRERECIITQFKTNLNRLYIFYAFKYLHRKKVGLVYDREEKILKKIEEFIDKDFENCLEGYYNEVVNYYCGDEAKDVQLKVFEEKLESYFNELVEIIREIEKGKLTPPEVEEIKKLIFILYPKIILKGIRFKDKEFEGYAKITREYYRVVEEVKNYCKNYCF